MSDQMGVFDAMYNCRAMRRLSGEPIPEADLTQLIEAAEQAASGGNTQRRRWIIVRDAEQKAKLAALNREVSADYVRGRMERGEALPHHDAETRGRMLKSVLWLAENMQDIHALVVACYEFDEAPSEAERVRVQSSVYPGVQNLLLAARAKGLGAVLTTYALNRYDEFVDVIGLPKNFAAYALIPLGYPLGKFGPVTRQPVNTLMRFDRWSGE
ncbi:MAG: nitroreductase family protein [Chromatiales bacterium]|jgi:nitroreductase|nr:nitroreductase family protein [Chromatiales bacterium]